MSRPHRHAPTLTTMSFRSPEAKEVYIAGTFNGWNETSHPMRQTRGGEWVLNMSLPPGRHEYKFIVDGRWCCDESERDDAHDGRPDCVENAFGTMNRVLHVRSTNEGGSKAQLHA